MIGRLVDTAERLAACVKSHLNRSNRENIEKKEGREIDSRCRVKKGAEHGLELPLPFATIISFILSEITAFTEAEAGVQKMPASALNPPPRLADLQRGPPPPASSSTPQHPAFGQSALRQRRNRSDSHSSHDSHGSHGSHSSHSSHSSYARRHPDRVPQKAASPNGAFFSVFAILTLVLVYTLVGLWVFVKGFLLTRHELTGVNECNKPFDASWSLPKPPATFDDESLLQWADTALNPTVGKGECRMAPTHKKAVMLIIDALRYDFIAPPPPPSASAGVVREEGEGWTPNPFYHNILSLPSEFTSRFGIPAHASTPGPSSFISHFTADPPTTTLQRLKGLTTGTLPTFVEAGANFGSAGTGVGQVFEDNWIAQFKTSILAQSQTAVAEGQGGQAGLVFAGDDTWNTVFPGLFDAMWTYDSFNVEDLDTVDRGVESRLLPYLQPNHPGRVKGVHDEWRLLIGHTLGVDHVGHRFGPSHPKMKTKLEEMQAFLRNMTDAVDKETLVVLMGDHGMDERGDHGGDAELEVGAGLWIFSKSGFGYTARNPKMRLDPADYISSAEVEALLPSRIPFPPLPSPPYPAKGHRSMPQIDLVPTISVLLGLPIPYNNLGSIIPDLFAHPNMLVRALRITATQMRTYLTTYAKHSPDLAGFGQEFDRVWLDAVRADAELAVLLHKGGKRMEEVEEAWRKAAQAYHRFNRISLVRAREIWAQFDMGRIVVGLMVLVLGIGVVWVLRIGAKEGLVGLLPVLVQDGDETADEGKEVRRSKGTEELLSVITDSIKRPTQIGAIVGLVVWQITRFTPALPLLGILESVLTTSVLSSQLGLLYHHLPSTLHPSTGEGEEVPPTTKFLNTAGWTLMIIHATLFASNSFLINEDRFVLLSLSSLLALRGLLAVGNAASTRNKLRAGVLTLLALILFRLAAVFRVCREEQGPQCQSTFFASTCSGEALNSPYIMAASYLAAYVLPTLLSRFLVQSKSFVGIAPLFFSIILRPTLMLGSGYWILDYVIPLDSIASSGWAGRLEWLKGWVAKSDLILLCLIAMVFWIFAPLCLEIRQEPPTPATTVGEEGEGEGGDKPKVTILGYANSLGSSYLLLLGIVISLLWLITQPAGQLAIAAIVLATMMTVELGDAERDVVVLYRQKLEPFPRPSESRWISPAHLSSAEIATLILLGHLAFFVTGHQPTFPSIQWRVAFLTSPFLSYPLSPILVALNSFGHLSLFPPLFVVLSVLWNSTPLPRGSGRKMSTPSQILSGLLGVTLYSSTVLVMIAGLSGLVFRRHLMLFKLWTPRLLLAAVTSLMGQVGGLAAGLAGWQVGNKVNNVFGSEFA